MDRHLHGTRPSGPPGCAARSPARRVKLAHVHRAFPEVAERTLKRDLVSLRDQGVLDAADA